MDKVESITWLKGCACAHKQGSEYIWGIPGEGYVPDPNTVAFQLVFRKDVTHAFLLRVKEEILQISDDVSVNILNEGDGNTQYRIVVLSHTQTKFYKLMKERGTLI